MTEQAVPEDNGRAVVGLMSGTSVDGIDACLMLTDGVSAQRTGVEHVHAYTPQTRDAIFDLTRKLSSCSTEALSDALTHDEELATLATRVADEHAEAVAALMDAIPAARFEQWKPSLLGFHGQTLVHRPQGVNALSLQCGDAQRLATLTQTDVVADFRRQDIEAGGQGAPLAPVYHQCLLKRVAATLPSVIVNIGGITNLSYIDDKQLIGFDAGPGNAIMDEWVRRHGQGQQDTDGALAASGVVDDARLQAALCWSWYDLAGPKSLDRRDVLEHAPDATGLSLPDALSTALQLTVSCIVKAVAQLPRIPANILVAGGGARNRELMRRLREAVHAALPQIDAANVRTLDSTGWGVDGDMIEAELMAYLAMRHVKGLALTFPGTTGVPQPQSGGTLYRACRP